MPRRPSLQIDFDHHRHEAQRLRRQAIDAGLDRLMTLLWRHDPGQGRPVTPHGQPTQSTSSHSAGEQRCPC